MSGPAGDPLVAEQMQALRADPDGAGERELDVTEREGSSFLVELMGTDRGLTLCGFARGGRVNVYAYSSRVL